MKQIIVREYLESLKEDGELDLIFPLLLESLDFKIVTRAKEYKGHKQYGKDIIAYGVDPYDNVEKRFYFELKGGNARHINAKNYSADDGIRMSLIEAIDRDYSDNSIEGFNELPVKIVIVHNGLLQPDVKETFHGFIEKNFPNGESHFARWGISSLTNLFSEYLFNEYLLTNDENIRLFKRMLVFMDVPENSQKDFYILVNNLISKTNTKALSKTYFPVHLTRFFETLKLIGLITHQYSKEANNLEISKNCVSFLILQTWYWILSNEIQSHKKIISKFKELLALHKVVLDEYFEKMLPIATTKYGLYSESGGRYEQIGFPIRCMDFIKYLTYWFSILSDEEKKALNPSLILTTIINNNDGCCRPLLDNHSIPILLVIRFFISNGDLESAKIYLYKVFEQILLGKKLSGILPDGNNNPESLIRLIVRKEKSIYYEDSGSMLIGMLFELLAILDMKKEYDTIHNEFNDIELSTYVPFSDKLLTQYLPELKISHEEALFKQELYREGFQSQIRLETEFESFKHKTLMKDEYSINYKTEDLGLEQLIDLAHLHYNTPFFPKKWRNLSID